MDGRMSRYLIAAYVFVLFGQFNDAMGHGRLMDPPARGTMWRSGFAGAKNYNDNQMFCGGFDRQWNINGGKCGVCGDPWDGPRSHEPGGIFYNGQTTRTYQSGQTINIDVELTANHLGWFEFRICPNNVADANITQDCLDQYLLPLQYKDGRETGTRRPIDRSVGHFITRAKLPVGVTCSHCMLQWKWHCGNSWGRERNGKTCIGCGAQEEFYGCANVAITERGGVQIPTTKLPVTTSTLSDVTTTSTSKTISPIVQSTQRRSSSPCYGINLWSGGHKALDDWCAYNCLQRNYCPRIMCKCDSP